MSVEARVFLLLGLATTAAALLPLAWGLMALGAAGVLLGIVISEGRLRRLTLLVFALLALGATGAGMALVDAL